MVGSEKIDGYTKIRLEKLLNQFIMKDAVSIRFFLNVSVFEIENNNDAFKGYKTPG